MIYNSVHFEYAKMHTAHNWLCRYEDGGGGGGGTLQKLWARAAAPMLPPTPPPLSFAHAKGG